MAEPDCIIHVRHHSQAHLVLGVAAGQPVQSPFAAVEPGQCWRLEKLAGTPTYVLHHPATGLALRFGAAGGAVTLAPFDPHDPGFVIYLDHTADGFVAVFNTSHELALSVAGGSAEAKAPVLAEAFDFSPAMQWKFMAA